MCLHLISIVCNRQLRALESNDWTPFWASLNTSNRSNRCPTGPPGAFVNVIICSVCKTFNVWTNESGLGVPVDLLLYLMRHQVLRIQVVDQTGINHLSLCISL